MKQIEDLEASGTIELGKPPHDAKVNLSMIQFPPKRDENGAPKRRNARYCARGDTYLAGPDVSIFAPTAPWATVRSLLRMACANNYVVKTFEVKAAFTSVDRTGLPDIWLSAPVALGYAPGYAFHLQTNLYGFQHSPRAFYHAFSEFLIDKLKFVRCAYDKTLFKRTTTLGITYVSLYVDDALVVSSSDEAWEELHQEVAKTYDLSSVGNATLHLGLTIKHHCNNGVLCLGSSNYI